MSSGEVLGVMRPGGRLVIGCAGFKAAVQDADQAVGKLAEGGVVALAAGAELVGEATALLRALLVLTRQHTTR